MSQLDDLRKQREGVLDFIESRPADVYERNIETYRETLDKLDAEIDALTSEPERMDWKAEAEAEAADYDDLKATEGCAIRDGVSTQAWFDSIEEVEL
jgi:hypothetical protein